MKKLTNLAIGSIALVTSMQLAASVQPQIAHSKPDFKVELNHLIVDEPAVIEESGSQSLTSAQGITYYEIYGVASDLYGGYEYPSTDKTITTFDHGGTVEVAVLQYGYGNQNGGFLNGASSDYYESAQLCGSLANLHFCQAGETITGWMHYYGFYNVQTGLFNSSSASIAVPFGTQSDSISVR